MWEEGHLSCSCKISRQHTGDVYAWFISALQAEKNCSCPSPPRATNTLPNHQSSSVKQQFLAPPVSKSPACRSWQVLVTAKPKQRTIVYYGAAYKYRNSGGEGGRGGAQKRARSRSFSSRSFCTSSSKAWLSVLLPIARAISFCDCGSV